MGDRLWWKGTAGSIGLPSPSELVTTAPTHPGSFRGVVGRICWRLTGPYGTDSYTAADIHGYSVTYHEGRWTLSAQLVARDPFKMSQRPLIFVAITRQTIGKALGLSAG